MSLLQNNKMAQQQEIINEDVIYESVFGKGILFFIGIAVICYCFTGDWNISSFNMHSERITYMLLGMFNYAIFWKSLWDLEYSPFEFNRLNNVFVYAIMNLAVAVFFNANFLLYLIVFQAILLNGFVSLVLPAQSVSKKIN